MALPARYWLALPLWFRHNFNAEVISDNPLGVGGDRGLVVALKLVVSAPFRFGGLVAMPNVTTLTADAGCRAANTSSFGTISTSWRQIVMTVTVDAGRRDAKGSGFGAISIRK